MCDTIGVALFCMGGLNRENQCVTSDIIYERPPNASGSTLTQPHINMSCVLSPALLDINIQRLIDVELWFGSDRFWVQSHFLRVFGLTI